VIVAILCPCQFQIAIKYLGAVELLKMEKNATRILKVSIKKGTFFEKSNLNLKQLLFIIWSFCKGHSNRFVEQELPISAKTVVDWYNVLREVCIQWAESQDQTIGGEGVVVEIDESMFTKRKYNRGRQRNGQWVFGGFERDSKKCFMVVVPSRGADVLLPLIKKYVRPGSIILSDLWAAYNGIESMLDDNYQPLSYAHGTVNHSETFLDPDTLIHTNGIEGQWSHAKKSLPKFGVHKALLDSYLGRFLWFRGARMESDDPFMYMLQTIAQQYPLAP
jgi:transposase-like protein